MMTVNNQTNRGRALLLSWVLAGLFSGCVGTTPHTQYRTHVPNPSVSGDPLGSFVTLTNLPDAAFTDRVDNRMVENYAEFLFSVVEFDDQGKLWDKRQLDALHQMAQDDVAQNNGAVLVTFVHGWDENAQVNNGTVWAFRRLLYQLYKVETNMDASSGSPRRIVGVYVGWRGRSQRLPLVKWLTFWNRKNTAHKIGRGDMDELLVHLDDLKTELSKPSEANRRATRLVVVGHSFGGAIVYSALDNILKESTLSSLVPYERGEIKTPRRIRAGAADLVVLVNPAFEGLLYSGLAEATAGTKQYNPRQTTVLMTIGAENDQATGIAFPAGQFFPSLVQNFKPNSQERALSITSLGHCTNYFTHHLFSSTGTNATPETAAARRYKPLNLKPWQRPVAPSTETVDWTQLVPPDHEWALEPWPKGTVRPKNEPFMVVTASKAVVDNHTGIWGKTLLEFLRDFIVAQDHLQRHLDRTIPASSDEKR